MEALKPFAFAGILFLTSASAAFAKEVRADQFGWKADDATAALQAAIDSGADVVRVPKMPSEWIVKPIFLTKDNQQIVFEPGVVVVAMKGAFQKWGDCLFSANSRKNITLQGYGATLAMQKPEYTAGEHRHVINLLSCEKVRILGLTLKDSGGDGVYVGSVARPPYGGTDIVIKDILCDNMRRQGVSVTSAQDLLIANCILKNINGAPPMDGIDFEPNFPRERLKNCKVLNCHITNCGETGSGVDLALQKSTDATEPFSISIDACDIKKTGKYGVISFHKANIMLKGSFELSDTRISMTNGAGVYFRNKTPDEYSAMISGVSVRDAGLTYRLPFFFQMDKDCEKPIGGVKFMNCLASDDKARDFMGCQDKSDAKVGVKDIFMEKLVVCNPSQQTWDLGEKKDNVKIDFKKMAKRVPSFSLATEPSGADRFVKGEKVSVLASAEGKDSSNVEKVVFELRRNGKALLSGSASKAPFAFSFGTSNLEEGVYIVRAEAVIDGVKAAFDAVSFMLDPRMN